MRALNNMRSILDTTFFTRILKRILPFLLLVTTFTIQGQTITSFEYYFGTDPGFGNGTSISADTNTGELTQDLVIDVTGLDEGFHKLTIRAVDSDSEYSLYSASTFFVIDPSGSGGTISNLNAVEYWFDTDPGQGSGTALAITGSPSETTENYVIPLGTLPEGFHTLGIRVQNLDLTWSLYTKSIFYVTEIGGSIPISNLANLEYWFDADPGIGNGNPLNVTGNPSTLTDTYAIPLGTLDQGFHSLSIRAQNVDGTWSLYDKSTFYVSEIAGSDPISNIQRLEYWFDTDPGFGSGTAIDITGGPSEFTDPLVIPLGTLDGGYHEVGIRAQNLDGTWSLYERKRFFIIDAADFATPPTAPLDEIEFLYDAELGFGTGTSLAFTPTSNPDEYLVEIPTDLVTCDIHDLWISMKNTDGNYSLYKILDDVDVFDNLPPTIVVFPDITVELDANGEGSITIADVDDGTFDDCELVSVVLNQTQFNYTCADLGANTVTITATDAESKVSTQDVTITVVDNINPVAVAQNITVQLDANGEATITANDLENGSTDNCSIVTRSIDISSFDCTNLGTNTVSFTVTDVEGNTNSIDATVTVEDAILPTAATQNITVQLDATGVASITADDVDLSTDNCTITTKSVDIDSFDCDDLGTNTVTLTVTDQSGNSNTATATITVEDNANPVAATQDITVQLDGNGNATIFPSQIENGSTDNCTVASSSLDITSFDCSNLGANTVTLTVTDQSGNSNTATAIVTVEDAVNPVAISQNITVQLDASGVATIEATDIDNNSIDNCGIDTRSLDIASFDCDDIGANTVTLTVTDASGNSNSTSATVTVIDNINPSVTTQNITVQLDASGTASIVAADVENSVTDNCGVASSVIDINNFDCNNLGDNTVLLTITDVNGNTTDANVTVTVEDSINPVALSQDVTVELDSNGNGTITAATIDNGSTDNCGIDTRSLDITNFNCSNLGDNTINLTVTDTSGNSNSISATVSVVDLINPVASGQDITVDLAGNPSVTIIANDLDNGSSDNCGMTSLSIDIDTFTMPGVYPVVLTIEDSSGNIDMVTVNVTVVDSTLSIDDVALEEKAIRLYPNPTEAFLYFDTELIVTEISIYDLNGKRLIVKLNPENNVNVNELSEGIYLIQFKIENSLLIKRFIKQ
jgi:hypothetical protein